PAGAPAQQPGVAQGQAPGTKAPAAQPPKTEEELPATPVHLETAFTVEHGHKITTDAAEGTKPNIIISSTPMAPEKLFERVLMPERLKVLESDAQKRVPGLVDDARAKVEPLQAAVSKLGPPNK